MTSTDTKLDDELLTLDEVAQLLKITRPQVLEFTRKRAQERSDNPLPVLRFHSKMLRVRRKDFVRWLERLAASQGVVEVHATTAVKMAEKSWISKARSLRCIFVAGGPFFEISAAIDCA
jgi:transcription initiation factor TFIIIB Brf1 subunit/transcription initiation factor TFIIB